MSQLKDKKFKDPRMNLLIGTVLDDIIIEDAKQINKWGVQSHTLGNWNMILGEEIGEMQQAMNGLIFTIDDTSHRERFRDAYKEAIQAATLLIKLAEILKENTL